MNTIPRLLERIPDKRNLLRYLQNYMSEDRTTRFLEVLQYRTRHFTLAVEDVYQERNASAIVRTADCFGIQDVHIIENYNEYQLSEGISKGANKWVNVHIYDQFPNNTEACISHLKGKGYQIIATSPNTENPSLEDFDIAKKSAFFLGGEKEGLTRDVLDQADGYLRIPMYGFTGSFNISVAGALVLYDLIRRLHHSDIVWELSAVEKLELQLDWTIKTITSSENLINKYLESNL